MEKKTKKPDIVPSLKSKIDKEFDGLIKKDRLIFNVMKKVKDGKADYEDAQNLAGQVAKLRSQALLNTIKADVLPHGQMYYNIAQRLVYDPLKSDYDLVSSVCEDVQTGLNEASNISLKAQVPEFNDSKAQGIVDKICEKPFEETKWLLKAPIENFIRSVVDDSVRENAKFQKDCGLKPEIVRTPANKCCEWCAARSGRRPYEPDMDRFYFQRHENCRCIMLCYPGDGKKVADVWSKQEYDTDNLDEVMDKRVQQRQKLEKMTMAKGSNPNTLGGVKKGSPMSFKKANSGNVNPDYGKNEGYSKNCQTCVVAFEARQRGYDVKAKANFKGSVSEQLSHNTRLAWIDPETGKMPEFLRPKPNVNTAKRYTKWLSQNVKEGERYTLEFAWTGRGNIGHIVNLDLDENGQLRLKDNQRGYWEKSEYIGEKEITEYLKEVKFKIQYQGKKYYYPPDLLRVDNLEFNQDVVDRILEGR